MMKIRNHACLKETFIKCLEKSDSLSLLAGHLRVPDCFPAGTPIAVSDTSKNIEDIIAGDEVWAWSGSLNEYALKKVTRITGSETDILVSLTIGSEVIETTSTHSFYLDGEWVHAGALEPGDKVMCFDGKKTGLETICYGTYLRQL